VSWLSKVFGEGHRRPDEPAGQHGNAVREGRPVSYYSAKQAFAKLYTYLRDQQRPLPDAIWQVIPELSVFYREQFYGMVGGWVFFYRDQLGKEYEARLNCWGDVRIESATSDFAKSVPRPVQQNEWLLDNTDAHMIVLSRGGRGNNDNVGGWLMASNIEGRGLRPLWAGHTWCRPENGSEIVVDAQTGELYQQIGRVPPKQSQIVEWNGDFDPTSSAAEMSRSQYSYWWPRAYTTTPLPRPPGVIGRIVYNRALLRASLQEESSRTSRNASSWRSSGVLQCVLGNWLKAIEDLDQAVQLAPHNDEFRYYRGLISMYIRDFASATSDFKGLSSQFEQQSDEGLRTLAILRGEQKRELSAIILNLQSNFGCVPLEIWIGAVPLRSSPL